MSDRKREILNCLKRMDYHGDDNPQLATERPYTVELFAANKVNITRLHEAGVTSGTSSAAGKSRTRSKVARAREIESDLRRVANAAKLIEKKVAGFENIFEIRSGNLSYQELIDKGNAFVAGRAASAAHFARYSLDDAFFNDLQTDVNELGEISHGQADAKRTGVGATADTEAILKDSLDVRSELITALENHYINNPVKLAEWRNASRIIRRGGSDPEPEPPENTEPEENEPEENDE